jgi:PhnB protein
LLERVSPRTDVTFESGTVDRIINAHLKSGNSELSATDRMTAPDYLPQYGDIFAISVLGEGYDERKAVFDKLSEGHKDDRIQDLHDLPFGTCGQFFDKYGSHWICKGDKNDAIVTDRRSEQ